MSLITLHKSAALVHTIHFAIVTISLGRLGKKLRWPIISRGFKNDCHIYEYNLGWLLPVFPILSSLNHTIAVFHPEMDLNYYRWIEYSVSAGVMLWLVASLSGVVEIRSLVSIAILNAALQYIGYLIEKSKLEKNSAQAKKYFQIGLAIHTAIWTQIFISFYTLLSYSDKKIPPMVYSIIIVMFSLFSSFGVWAGLWAYDKIKSYSVLETGYIMLSLVSKSILIYLVYFGIINADVD